MRGLVRAAAYLPSYTDGRRRVAGPDEDAFTLVATALERTLDRGAEESGPHVVRVVGARPLPDAAMLSAVIGAPAQLAPQPPRSLLEAIEQAMAAPGPEWIVAVELGTPPEGDGRVASPGDGAAALRIGEASGAFPLSTLQERLAAMDSGRAPLGALFALARSEQRAKLWAGDWGAEPSRGLLAPAAAATRLEPPPVTVSEGALVPGPREEEGRASRWRFIAERCGACASTTFPQRGRCRGCGRTDGLSPVALPLDGARVVASTWIGPGGQPTEFDLLVESAGSYGVVLAEIGHGARATLAVSEATPAEVQVGATVDTRLRRLYPMEGRWRYGRKAVPAPAGAGPSG